MEETDDEALVRERMGDVHFEMLQRTIILTARTISPHNIEEAYANVIRKLADSIRKEMH